MTEHVGLTRRAWIAGASAAPLAATTAAAQTPPAAAPAAPSPSAGASTALPALDQFPGMNVTYLDAGSIHPFSVGARQAVADFLSSRAMGGQPPGYGDIDREERVIGMFAELINATPAEIAFVQSTTMGEWLTIRSLGIPESGGRIVTDDLHFFGSFVLYNELKKQGMDVVIVRARADHKVHLEDLAAAVNGNTKLIAVSAVSTINGFQHELKPIADLAHAHGAKLYVDAIHGCGVVPIDVRASGVDFLASASYKWLMGDMGLGFLYCRADLLPTLKQPQIGYEQAAAFRSHAYPYDPPGDPLFETALRTDAQGHFGMGTKSNTVVAQLYFSLDYIKRLGLDAMREHRQPLLDKAKREIPRIAGFSPMTPDDCTSALAAFAYRDARTKLGPTLRAANVRVTLSANRLRVSGAVFNTMADVDRLLNVLESAPHS